MRETVIDLEVDQETGDYVQKKREGTQRAKQPQKQPRRKRPAATAPLHQILDGVEAGCDLVERAAGIFNKYARKLR